MAKSPVEMMAFQILPQEMSYIRVIGLILSLHLLYLFLYVV